MAGENAASYRSTPFHRMVRRLHVLRDEERTPEGNSSSSVVYQGSCRPSGIGRWDLIRGAREIPKHSAAWICSRRESARAGPFGPNGISVVPEVGDAELLADGYGDARTDLGVAWDYGPAAVGPRHFV